MREMLFRGKRTDNGEWVYGYYFKTPLTEEATGAGPKDGYYFLCGQTRYCIATENGCVYEVIPETVGQYTILTDKNGKKIFGGDIIEGGYLNPLTNKFNSKKYVAEFKQATFICKLIGHSPYGDTWLYFVHGKVIGNIHDNPELLEGIL